MKPLSECRYSAFISYSHAADKAHGKWVTYFQRELSDLLQGRLHGQTGGRVPGMHLSGKNGPVAGTLGTELENNIADSFAMVIVVEENYLRSGWCMKELEYFRARFGERGFKERLYVIAMSQPAADELAHLPDWKRLAPEDLVWIPFFDDDEPVRPMRMYLDNEAMTSRFQQQLERVAERLVKSVLAPPPPAVVKVAPPPLPPGGAGTRVLIGVPSPEFDADAAALAEQLRARGVAVQQLDEDALEGDLAAFDQAEMLVLPIGSGGQALPAFRFVKGGHLAVQRDAWLEKGRPEAGLVWLDLRARPCSAPPGKGHAELLAEVGAAAVTPEALLARYSRPERRASDQQPAQPRAERVNIYIESNQHEVDVWDDLGERIKARWQRLLTQYEPATVPALHLHARGLPVQKLDDELLDDADGLVLLWGNKTEESLRAQIRKVESKIEGEPPPGIVAYLIPQREDPQQAIEAKLWNVLRFKDSTSAAIDIVPPESERLDRFLRKILDRTAKRKRPPAAARVA